MPNAVDAGLHDEVAVDSYQPAESFSSVTVLPSGASARVTEPLPTVNKFLLALGMLRGSASDLPSNPVRMKTHSRPFRSRKSRGFYWSPTGWEDIVTDGVLHN